MFLNIVEKGKVRSYICHRACCDGSALVSEVKRGLVDQELFYRLNSNRLWAITNKEEAKDFVKIFLGIKVEMYDGIRGVPFFVKWDGNQWVAGDRKFGQFEEVCRFFPFRLKKSFYRKYKKVFRFFYQKEK